jgi:hypothetical protein
MVSLKFSPFSADALVGVIIKKLLLIILLPFASIYAKDPVNERNITFHNFPWGTSQEDFIKKMGNPVHRDEVDGIISLVWENIVVSGYKTFMLAYFTKNGLQGGTYYFLTYDMDQLMKCYTEIKQELRNRYGPTPLFRDILKELREYECLWEISGNYVHLKTNTRQGEPVTLFYLSPELARQIMGTK